MRDRDLIWYVVGFALGSPIAAGLRLVRGVRLQLAEVHAAALRGAGR